MTDQRCYIVRKHICTYVADEAGDFVVGRQKEAYRFYDRAKAKAVAASLTFAPEMRAKVYRLVPKMPS